ncbi:MAG TPA: hypothetical protein VGJ15_05885, partial [Pirellulales bacterium]
MTTNLVICPIGDRTVHRTWLAGPAKPNFDLFLIYFGDGPDTFATDAKYYVCRKGFKWEHIHFVATEHRETLAKYEHIWCPDDDVACDTAGVNLLFDIFKQYNLQLAQPAISHGDFSYKGLAQRPGNILRYSPYVEVMCPLFTRAALEKVQDTFTETRSGWGIDWVWPHRFCSQEVAVIDRVGVNHTGKLGQGENYKNLARLGIDPHREFQETVARHGGFDRNIHRRLLRGRLKMRRIKDPADRRSMNRRLVDYL